MYAWKNRVRADENIYAHFASAGSISLFNFLLLNAGYNPLADGTDTIPEIGEVSDIAEYVEKHSYSPPGNLDPLLWFTILADHGVPLGRPWVVSLMRVARDKTDDEHARAVSFDEFVRIRTTRSNVSSVIWRDTLSDDPELHFVQPAVGNFERTRANLPQDAKIHALNRSDGQLQVREQTTYLNIIGALIDVIMGKCPSLPANAGVASEAQLIAVIAEKYDGVFGLSKSNLERKFPKAKRSLDAG